MDDGSKKKKSLEWYLNHFCWGYCIVCVWVIFATLYIYTYIFHGRHIFSLHLFVHVASSPPNCMTAQFSLSAHTLPVIFHSTWFYFAMAWRKRASEQQQLTSQSTITSRKIAREQSDSSVTSAKQRKMNGTKNGTHFHMEELERTAIEMNSTATAPESRKKNY